MCQLFKKVEWFSNSNDPLLNEIKADLIKLHPKFKSIEIYEGEKSYTINKQRVYICLKDKNGRYYNRNMLVYVICHELAHVLCDEIGHTEKFHEVFSDLLEQATNAGLYNPSIPPLKNYCGHN
jgi:hypothetical protein